MPVSRMSHGLCPFPTLTELVPGWERMFKAWDKELADGIEETTEGEEDCAGACADLQRVREPALVEGASRVQEGEGVDARD